MKYPENQYVTLHASVLAKVIMDIAECAREQNWTDEQVHQATRGVFVTARKAGGTIEDIEHLTNLLVSDHGRPDVTKH